MRSGAVCSSRYRTKVKAWFNFCPLLCHDKLSNLAKRRGYVLKIEALKVPFPTGSQDISNSVSCWAGGWIFFSGKYHPSPGRKTKSLLIFTEFPNEGFRQITVES